MERKIFSCTTTVAIVILLICGAVGVCLADVASDLEQGKSLYTSGSYDSAIDYFNKILTDYPGSEAASECNYWLGFCYWDKQDPDRAIAKFKLQVQQFPENFKSLRAVLEVGQIHLDREEYDKVITWANQVISKYPNLAMEAHSCLGSCYKAQGNYKEAIASYQAAIASASAGIEDDHEVMCIKSTLGTCYQETAQWDTAIKLYTQMIEDYPDNAARCKIELGVCYQGKKDYEKAIAIYKEVAGQYPKEEGNALLRIDDCLGDLGKYEEKLAYLNELYDKLPEQRAEILFRRGITRGEIYGEYDNAIDDLDQLISDYPDHWRFVEAKARIAEVTLNGLRDTAGARRLLEQFIAEYPDYELMMFVKLDLATCSFHECDWLEAARLYEETLGYEDVGNFHPYTLYIMTSCYKSAGDMVKARETVNRLITNYPGDCWSHLAYATFAELMTD